MGDLSDFQRGQTVGARIAGATVSEDLNIGASNCGKM